MKIIWEKENCSRLRVENQEQNFEKLYTSKYELKSKVVTKTASG